MNLSITEESCFMQLSCKYSSGISVKHVACMTKLVPNGGHTYLADATCDVYLGGTSHSQGYQLDSLVSQP